MFDLQYFLHAGFFEIRFWDIPNLAICWFLIVFFGLRYRVPNIYLLFLFLHTLIPFFLVGVLFDYYYMPDILKYWEVFNLIRNGDMVFIDAFYDNPHSKTVSISAAFYALFPFPVAASPISIGFFNIFIYLIVFFFSYRKNLFSRSTIWFYLLFPSLALYSALGLRDMLIFFFMFFSMYYMFLNRFTASFLFSVPLFFIKFQNFFILAVVFLLYYVFVVLDARKRPLLISIVSIALLGVAQFIFPYVSPYINLYRRAMFYEDGGVVGEVASIDSFYSFLFEGAISAVRFLTKPFPHEASGILQIIQSIENILVLLGVIFILKRIYDISYKHFIFWFLFLSVSFVVYGLVVFNFGTAVRYRFPFIVLFFIFASHTLKTVEFKNVGRN